MSQLNTTKQLVTQKGPLGCGLACVAFICENNYWDTYNPTKHIADGCYGYKCRDLVEILSFYNKKYSYKYLKPKLRRKIYREGVIVFIKRSKRYPCGHYLTYHNGVWADSWINLPFDDEIINAKSGFRKRLPGRPIFALFPLDS